MDALTYIATKYDLDLRSRHLPIEIPNTGRADLARLFFLLGYTVGAEVGVERGAYATVLNQAIPGLRYYGVDAWTAYKGYRDHVSQPKLDGFYQQTQVALAAYPRATVIRAFSVDAARQFELGSLDFVYLDAAHDLASVMADLAVWAPKVRPGGIVAGHDYIKAKLPSLMHVPQAIHAWTDAYQIEPWFVLGTKAKVPGEVRDDGRSWFYVQPERVPIPRAASRPIQQ